MRERLGQLFEYRGEIARLRAANRRSDCCAERIVPERDQGILDATDGLLPDLVELFGIGLQSTARSQCLHEAAEPCEALEATLAQRERPVGFDPVRGELGELALQIEWRVVECVDDRLERAPAEPARDVAALRVRPLELVRHGEQAAGDAFQRFFGIVREPRAKRLLRELVNQGVEMNRGHIGPERAGRCHGRELVRAGDECTRVLGAELSERRAAASSSSNARENSASRLQSQSGTNTASTADWSTSRS